MTKVRKSSPPTTEEEKGEVIESGPPLQLGEERILDASSVKKKLHKHGIGWETPKHGAEATGSFDFIYLQHTFTFFSKSLLWLILIERIVVHYVGTLLDGKIFNSTRNDSEPVILTVKVDEGEICFFFLILVFLDWLIQFNFVCLFVVGPLLFLEKCIMTMTRGELSLFTMPADLGYGAEGCDNVPTNSVI